MFWSIYIYDRELVYPKLLDNFIPAWLNHGMVSKVMQTLPCINKSVRHWFPCAWLCIHLELIPSEVIKEHCLQARITSFLLDSFSHIWISIRLKQWTFEVMSPISQASCGDRLFSVIRYLSQSNVTLVMRKFNQKKLPQNIKSAFDKSCSKMTETLNWMILYHSTKV